MTMLLHAKELSFIHPHTNEKLVIQAEIQLEFKRMINSLDFNYDS